MRRTPLKRRSAERPPRKPFTASVSAPPTVSTTPRVVAGNTASSEMREPRAKRLVVKSKRLRQSAKGQRCTLQVAGVCRGQTDTVVLCHYPCPIKGSKSSDAVSSGFACSLCHDWLDYRDPSGIGHADREFYMRRSVALTQTYWLEQGLLIEGAA